MMKKCRSGWVEEEQGGSFEQSGMDLVPSNARLR
jgi:hypothetical protein